MLNVDLNQPVVVTWDGDVSEPVPFDSLRKALHTVLLEFEPEKLSSAFICTKQGGLNIVEIRALHSALRKTYAGCLTRPSEGLAVANRA